MTQFFKTNISIIIFLVPILLFGNMANPWIEGTKHSTLFGFGSENCDVLEEYINIDLSNIADNFNNSKYNIKYVIHSTINQQMPLLFIGLGLEKTGQIIINNKPIKILKYDLKNSVIQYSKEDVLEVKEKDLIYFNANLIKGKNIIEISYTANLSDDNRGFLREYELEYLLYPSKFWKSFGTSNIKVELPKNYEVIS